MENLEALSPDRITEFLSASAGIDFTWQNRTERYFWLQGALIEQRYFSLSKKQRGVVRALLPRVAGLSLPPITRLIRSYREQMRSRCKLGAASLPGQIRGGGFGIAD
jgi:hypothetical protein